MGETKQKIPTDSSYSLIIITMQPYEYSVNNNYFKAFESVSRSF